jgi:hypothetical protein
MAPGWSARASDRLAGPLRVATRPYAVSPFGALGTADPLGIVDPGIAPRSMFPAWLALLKFQRDHHE